MKQTHFNRTNAILLCAITAGGGLLLWLEGYIAGVTVPFVVFGAVVFALAFWVAAFEVSTRRFVTLAVVAGTGGYVTQYVGATLMGAWNYPPPNHTYYFVPSMFVLASTMAFGSIRSFVGPWMRRRLPGARRGINPFLIAVPVVILIAGSREFSDTRGTTFWLYYGVMTVTALWGGTRMNAATLLTVILSAVVVGGASEIMGARSGLWAFANETDWLPQPFLVFGSWPIEIMFHYSVSGLLSGEPLLARPHTFKEDAIYEPVVDHPMYTGEHPIVVASISGNDKFNAMDEVLRVTGFFDALERRASDTGKPAAQLEIVVKPNLMFLYSPDDTSTFTDPSLVEGLIDRMISRGYRRIALVEAQSAYGNYFKDRGVTHVAEVAGYHPNGRYEIVDLTEDKVPYRFDGPLGAHVVGKRWRDADFRISFAKNKTHTWAWYTLAIKNIYGALPMQDKIREYHYKREIYYPTIDMLRAFPVHFGLIDAWTSADGPFGIFADKTPVETRTILGSENIVALDWVGASKMRLDPMVSRYMQLAVQSFGKPQVEVRGDASVYDPWQNVPKPVIDFWDHAEEAYGFTSTVFQLINRNYVSHHFPKRPTTRWKALLGRLLGPIGGLVYRSRRPSGS